MTKRFDFINGKYRLHQEDIKNPSPIWNEKHGKEIFECPKCKSKVFKIKNVYGKEIILNAYPDYDGRIFITESKQASNITPKTYRPMPRYTVHSC